MYIYIYIIYIYILYIYIYIYIYVSIRFFFFFYVYICGRDARIHLDGGGTPVYHLDFFFLEKKKIRPARFFGLFFGFFGEKKFLKKNMVFEVTPHKKSQNFFEKGVIFADRKKWLKSRAAPIFEKKKLTSAFLRFWSGPRIPS